MANLSEEGNPCFRPSSLASWFMGRLFAIPWLAHHPPCRCYANHVLRVGRLVLCLGCTCMALGGILTAALMIYLVLSERLGVGWPNSWALIGVGVGFYAPTLLQPFCQWKPYKIVARTLLGAAVTVLTFGGLLLSPLTLSGLFTRIGFLTVFWLVLHATLRQRARYTPDPCSRCESSVYPFCSDNRSQIDAILQEVYRRAGPEDAAFVAFATALSGKAMPGISVDVKSLDLSIRNFGSAEAGTACHGTSFRRHCRSS